MPQKPAQKRAPSKKATQTDNDDFEVEIAAAPAAAKKGGRKPAGAAKAAAAAKPPVAAKKRGAAARKEPQTSSSSGQKLLTDMLKPAESSGVSPDTKVRKMRESPFNKKSGSVLSRVNLEDEMNESEEKSEAPMAAGRARPQRAAARKAMIVMSESEEEAAETDDSDVEEIDSEDSE